MKVSNFGFQSDILGIQNSTRTRAKIMTDGKKNSFESFYDTYMGLIDETNVQQVDLEKLELDYAAGRTDDMAAVLLAQKKAYTSLNFTVQVTNKIVEAYREIMRIQI